MNVGPLPNAHENCEGQCEAHAKKNGAALQALRGLPGKRVCNLHGGLTPSGLASPNFEARPLLEVPPQEHAGGL
jgi:hypothetical protein